MIHSHHPITTGECAPQDVAVAQMPLSEPAAEGNVAHQYHVIYTTGGQHGALWEVQVVAASVEDADRAVRYFAQHRHDAIVGVIAVVLTETVK